MPVLVKTRKVAKNMLYLCPIDGWVIGKPVNLTGYTDLLCEHCDFTLVSDYLGYIDLENQQGKEQAG